MPLFYQNNISENTKLAVWKIEEMESFFLQYVPLQRAITHPHKRLQHLAGRYILQFLFPDFPFNEIIIADTRKPYLPYEQYHFSISHCGNYAAAIASREKRVGIDIEIPSEKIVRIQNKFLNEKELFFLMSLVNPVGNKVSGINPELSYITNERSAKIHQLPTLLWSAKETIFKWWSYGNVDFSEHIQLQPFNFLAQGNINAIFLRTNENYNLNLQYSIFNSICLTWLFTNN